MSVTFVEQRRVERFGTVLHIDGVDLPVGRMNVRLLAVEDDATADTTGGARRDALAHSMPVLPQEVAGRGIECVDNATRNTEEHDAVVHDRPDPVVDVRRRTFFDSPRPDELKPADVALVDRFERTV